MVLGNTSKQVHFNKNNNILIKSYTLKFSFFYYDGVNDIY